MNVTKTGGTGPPDNCYSPLTVEPFVFDFDEDADFTALPDVRPSWLDQGQSVLTSSARAKELETTKMIAINSFIKTPYERNNDSVSIKQGGCQVDAV